MKLRNQKRRKMQDKNLNDSMKGMKGWTERRLFDTPKFIALLNERGVDISANKITSRTLVDAYEKALAYGLSKKEIGKILDKAAKPMFKDNFLWKFLHKHFSLDIKIPVLFGFWTTAPIRLNTITTVGKQASAQQIGGTTTSPVTAIAIGVGTPSATALGSESSTNGGTRGAASVSNQTTTLTGDTERWIKTFTFTGALALTEEGLFDNNTSGGVMLASQSFSAVNVANTDTLQITHNVKYA